MSTSFIESISKYLTTQPVNKAWVFGSYSRGEEREDSDIDLLVEYDRKNHSIGLFTIIRIQQQLQELLGKEVDLVEEGTLMPFAIESANRDKVLIYERID
ncbi:MAG: nucleotidyltransferase domain-containing protein [Prevotellaceae bacterium]|nr:nucleotidyltransferase domain-containing protein [Prevotellaceae bacterium]